MGDHIKEREFQSYCFYASKRVWEMTAAVTVSLGSVSAAQRLKMRGKQGFEADSRTEGRALTPQLGEEPVQGLELVTQIKGQPWSDACPCSGCLLATFSPFLRLVSLVGKLISLCLWREFLQGRWRRQFCLQGNSSHPESSRSELWVRRWDAAGDV